MTEIRIRLDEDLERQLQGAIHRIGSDGIIRKHLVAWIDGKLRAEVRANEHPPPHFHITYNGEDASYSIETGLRLPNVYGLERYDKAIHFWWKAHRREIALTWNKSRPSGCPVGPINVPES